MVFELKNIYKDYLQGKEAVPVLKDISLDVSEGEYVAIMGPSGSGKSTLMNIIGCLDKQTKGSFVFDGCDIMQAKDRKLSEIRNKKIGQKQRVAIARAIVNNPKLLLADEPTGALDTKSGDQVMELFKELNDDGVTIVMITHEPDIARCAKRIMYIRDGELHGEKAGEQE